MRARPRISISATSSIWVAAAFGGAREHPVIAHVPGYPEILDSRGSKGRVTDAAATRQFRAADKWHVDVTFRAEPSLSAVLRARELASLSSGDTLWVDAAAAYEGPDDEVKERI